MAFSLFVEILNIKIRKGDKTKKEPKPTPPPPVPENGEAPA
jgi:hypothetical protein